MDPRPGASSVDHDPEPRRRSGAAEDGVAERDGGDDGDRRRRRDAEEARALLAVVAPGEEVGSGHGSTRELDRIHFNGFGFAGVSRIGIGYALSGIGASHSRRTRFICVCMYIRVLVGGVKWEK